MNSLFGRFILVAFLVSVISVFLNPLVYTVGFEEWFRDRSAWVVMAIGFGAYMLSGVLTYLIAKGRRWLPQVLIWWGISLPILLVPTIVWINCEIHDGMTGLLFLSATFVNWVFSIVPVLAGCRILNSGCCRTKSLE